MRCRASPEALAGAVFLETFDDFWLRKSLKVFAMSPWTMAQTPLQTFYASSMRMCRG